MTNCAYSEMYLSDALNNMGELIEYADEKKMESMDDFFNYFIMSGYASRWDAGDPRVISGMSGTELYFAIHRSCGIYDDFDDMKPLVRYDAGPAYWCGYSLAYYHYRSGRPFVDIINNIDYQYLFRIYPSFHMVSDEKIYVELEDHFKAVRGQMTRLQAYRKRIDMTQKKLSDESGVNLRTLQQYEIGDKDIKKASADKVISLAGVLHVEPKLLIDD